MNKLIIYLFTLIYAISNINSAEKTVLTPEETQKILGIKSWIIKLKANRHYIFSIGYKDKTGKYVQKTNDYDYGTKKKEHIKIILHKHNKLTLLGNYAQFGPDKVDLNYGASTLWIKPEFKNGFYKLAICENKEKKFLHTLELKITEAKSLVPSPSN